MSKFPDWSTLSQEQRIGAIKPLAGQGLSAGMIAKRFVNATRNAIIGYCARHEITLKRAEKKRRLAAKPTATPAAEHRATGTEPRLAFVKETVFGEKPIPDIVALGPISKSHAFDPIAGIAPVSLENLGAKRCHWPVNGLQGLEPIFCGAPASNLYCTSHERLAYTPR